MKNKRAVGLWVVVLKDLQAVTVARAFILMEHESVERHGHGATWRNKGDRFGIESTRVHSAVPTENCAHSRVIVVEIEAIGVSCNVERLPPPLVSTPCAESPMGHWQCHWPVTTLGTTSTHPCRHSPRHACQGVNQRLQTMNEPKPVNR
eukprot:GHVU01164011.1.p1 GENE.GHVU01164011.1~~GHVU01164011.1.p1  ORF type:complete len:149 (-),score=2.02 GHVU01164011.1:236-682(-)